jgi:hypothetical protein
MSIEVRFRASYQVVKFLVCLINYHEKILNDELEVEARDKIEITEELENYSDLKIRLLLYLGKYTKELEVGFYERDIVLLDKICYLHFVVTKKIIKADNKLKYELEQFHMQLKEYVNIIEGNKCQYLN